MSTTQASENQFKQQNIQHNDDYTLRTTFNGTEIRVHLTLFKNGFVQAYFGKFHSGNVDANLIKAYLSLQNIYSLYFNLKKKPYEIYSDAQQKAIQLSYSIKGKDQKKTLKLVHWFLQRVHIPQEEELKRTKQFMRKSEVKKNQMKKQIQSLKNKNDLQAKQFEQIKKDLQKMQMLACRVNIPLFISSKDVQNIKRCDDPNQIVFIPKDFEAEPAYLLIKNKISLQKPFTLKIKINPLILTQKHAIGVTSQANEKRVKQTTQKIMYNFKGWLMFGDQNQIPCSEIISLNSHSIQMTIDLKNDIIEFRNEKQVFASAKIKSLFGTQLRPFVMIGHYNMKYHLSIQS